MVPRDLGRGQWVVTSEAGNSRRAAWGRRTWGRQVGARGEMPGRQRAAGKDLELQLVPLTHPRS